MIKYNNQEFKGQGTVQESSVKDPELATSNGHTKATATYGRVTTQKELITAAPHKG